MALVLGRSIRILFQFISKTTLWIVVLLISVLGLTPIFLTINSVF